MWWSGRVVGRSICARFFHFCAAIAIVSCTEYGVPIEIKYWDTGRPPLSHMVDTTNEFGLKVLAEHNFLNDNNIAFSPYGLMGIMVALYEGVEGDSSYQIQRAMQLPWNRNVMRIGFRDIHRTLKTYFVPEEGFLAGLALNNENVTFSENYKTVLRFYGFDFESEETTTASPNSTNISSTTVGPAESADSTLSTTVTTTLNNENVLTSKTEESSANPSTTVNVVTEPTTTPLSSTTSANEDIPSTNGVDTTPTTTLNNIMESTAKTTEVSFETTMTSSTVPVSSTTSEPTSTTITTLNTDVEILTDISSSTTESTSERSLSTTNEASTLTTENIMTTIIAENSEGTSIMPTSTDITSTLTTESTSESTTSTTDLVTSTSENSLTSTETLTSTTESLTSTTESVENNAESVLNSPMVIVNESNLETLERRKKSIVDFIFTNPPYIDDYMLFRSYDIGPDISNTGYGGDQFLINGLKKIQVTYMNYDTVLEHAYLPHLEASALRLPLDSERYYLLVVLPNRRRAGELERLLTRMARESDLSDVYAALRPRRVRALVPSFIVKGHITLTTDLQKLGIRNVFEPRQHDFTPMTCQAGVYVRSIEQAVSVAIRKYQPDDIKKNRYVTNRRRVYFSATYPFLYFVMDTNIHVALMAGKMVDPLNTRIL